MRFKRTKSKCDICPLRDEHKILGEGPDNPKIFFLGDAPGAMEASEKKPFVGPIGDYFNWGLHQADILRYKIWVTNIICCKPPNINSDEAIEAIECCKEGLIEELNFFKNSIKVIGCLGNVSMKAMGIEGNIMALRGSVFGKYLPTIPTYHPFYLSSQGHYKKGGAAVDLAYVWISDLLKIKRISEKGWAAPKENFILSPSFDELFLWIETAQKDLIAVDIETTGWHGDVSIIGLAKNSEDAISVPLILKDGSSYWGNDTEKVIELVEGLFKTNKLMFQNALFDVKFLLERGWKIPFKNIQHDTMLLHHAVNPELPHNLGFIVSLYGDTPYWKDVDDKAWNRPYNLRDCVVLHQVLPRLLEELESPKIYNKESIPLIKPILHMMMNGFSYNPKILNKFIKELKLDQDGVVSKLFKLGKLPITFNLASGDDMRYFLYNILPNKLTGLDELLGSKAKKNTDIYRKIQTKIRLRDETKPIYQAVAIGRRTPAKRLKIDAQGRLSLQRQLNNRGSLISSFKRPTDKHKKDMRDIKKLTKWLDIFSTYKINEKIITTYSKFKVGKDKKVHTSLLIHGTVTGRLASRNPNLQNLPFIIRDSFIASEGCILMSGDYSNLEVRVLAYETNDDVLIKALEDGVNIHDMNTKELFKINETNKLWKECRAACKVFFFGGTAYGGSLSEIYDKVLLAAPNAMLTFAAFKLLIKQIETDHPKILEYKERITEQVLKERKISNFMGRIRVLLGSERDIIKEGLNFAIQSGAASIINQSTIRIDNILDDLKLKTKMILQVHDELIFDVPLNEVKKMKVILKAEMETPINFYGRMRTFPINIKIGKSWGSLG